MDLQIALLLGQDGLANGAIYALLALALVLVFTVTRVIFIPQGEFLAFGALTLASLEAGKTPGTLWLLIISGTAVALLEGLGAWRSRERVRLLPALGWNLAYPGLVAAVVIAGGSSNWPLAIQVIVSLAIVVPLGPMLYRLAFQPLAEASVLVLLIASVAVHLVLVGLGLLLFGAEGSRTTAFSEAIFEIGSISVNGQTVWVLGSSLALIAALYIFFEHTLRGKALRATAINRTGARLMGISTTNAGKLSFGLAAAIGGFSGILIGPITTVYYDSGFLIGLKGFVGAIIGGLASYPIAAAGSILVGLLEAYSSFWASAYKEVIVFTLIIPVLLWRSLRNPHVDEDQ
jgi:branched-chain amino acid transport system permease protein